MPRRVSLPGASELFRPTSGPVPGLDDDQPELVVEEPAPRRRSTTRRKDTAQPVEAAVTTGTVEDEVAAPARGTRGTKGRAVAEPVEQPTADESVEQADVREPGQDEQGQDEPAPRRTRAARGAAAASGRVRHDEKITVYVSREELLALETGRLALRGDFDLAVDRGRIVRESIALAMEDLERRGADSDLVRRLTGE